MSGSAAGFPLRIGINPIEGNGVAVLAVYVPELAMEELATNSPSVTLAGTELRAIATYRFDYSGGAERSFDIMVSIPTPGIYTVVARVSSADDGAELATNELWMQDISSKQIRLQVDDTLIVRRADESNEAALIPSAISSAALIQTSGGTSALRQVVYFHNDTGLAIPVPNAKIIATSNLGGSTTTYADNLGRFTIECPYSGVEQFDVVIYSNNADVIVYTGTFDAVLASYTETVTTCGQSMTVPVASNMKARVFDVMNRTLTASRTLFGRSRPRIFVEISSSENNSYYDPEGDEIVILSSHVWGAFGAFVQAHEYGHAFHEKGLGGNVVSGMCPSPHYLDGHHSYGCAYSEGFANYHAVLTLGSETGSFLTNIEGNAYYSPPDGADVEGVVAATLFDLSDAANESHDATDYTPSYIGDIIRTCEVQFGLWFRSTGIDHLIYCLERNLDPAVLSSSTFFPGRTDPTAVREFATEPYNWSASNIRRGWAKNLYDVVPPSPEVPLSGIGLTGPTTVQPGVACTWYAQGENGATPYSIRWEIDGVFYDSGIGSPGHETTFENAGSDFTLAVTVTDAAGDAMTYTQPITVTENAHPCLV